MNQVYAAVVFDERKNEDCQQNEVGQDVYNQLNYLSSRVKRHSNVPYCLPEEYIPKHTVYLLFSTDSTFEQKGAHQKGKPDLSHHLQYCQITISVGLLLSRG